MKYDYVSVMLSFLKMGVISFGGGSALIPVIEDEIVEKKKWIEKEPFDFSVIVASISPASLSVALCAVWSGKYSLISSYAYALPGPLLFLILLTGFSLIGETGVRYIGFASVGIIAFILLILFSFIRKNYLQGAAKGIKRRYLLILAAAFLLTCGNIVRRIISGLSLPDLPDTVFSLTMIDLIFMAFFVIFFMGGSTSKVKLGAALSLSGFYALTRGGAVFGALWAAVSVAMIALALLSVLYDVIIAGKSKTVFKINKKPLKNLCLFLLISAGLTAAIFIISGDSRIWDFAVRVMLSSLMSYGGGEVYIGVADGVFVRTGFIAAEDFYGRVVGFSSAMPGSVLLATVAGIGFVYGSGIGGVASGWLFGLLGVALGVAATAFGALVLYIGFDIFKDSRRLYLVIKYMMAIVCGVLISTALTLLNQASSVLIREGVNAWLSIGIVLLIFLLMLLLSKKYKISNMKLLFTGGFGTLFVLGLLF